MVDRSDLASRASPIANGRTATTTVATLLSKGDHPFDRGHGATNQSARAQPLETVREATACHARGDDATRPITRASAVHADNHPRADPADEGSNADENATPAAAP